MNCKMNCKICDGMDTTWFTPEVRKCSKCSSLYRIHLIDYNKEYIEKNYWFDISKSEWEWVPIEQENQANFIKRDLIQKPGSLLVEFGCANGYIAQYLAQYQDRIIIQEIVDIMVKEVRDNLKISFILGTFEDSVKMLKSNSVTNVVMNNVIEHINDIQNTFTECKRIIEPKGRFIIITDDGDNPFGCTFAMLGHPEHCFCITKAGIMSLCAQYGFSIIKFWRMTDYLSYIVLEKNAT